MNIKQAKEFAIEFIGKHPHFKEEVKDLYQLMLDEIEEGGSVTHEVNLFIGGCEDLLNDEIN